MTVIKHEYPILERDSDPVAIIMPNRHKLYSLPRKCVFAFLGEAIEQYATKLGGKIIGEFDSITKKYPIYSVTYKGEEVCLCQAPCGASPATQILDFLISYGVEYIIACGSCGALENIGENEIIIPVEALRDEGTSYHYIEPSRSIQISKVATETIKRTAVNKGIKYIECKTWTTDGFFRETKDLVEYRKQEGCSVVEMECSALAACAKLRGATFGQILFTADILINPDAYDERGWGISSYESVFLLSLEAVVQMNS